METAAHWRQQSLTRYGWERKQSFNRTLAHASSRQPAPMAPGDNTALGTAAGQKGTATDFPWNQADN